MFNGRQKRDLKEGLAATRRYLLSHHRPEDQDRCHVVGVRGRRLLICARCSGVYPGIVMGLVAEAAGILPGFHLTAIAILPAPALLDHTLTTVGPWQGQNVVRTTTGLGLGAAYGIAVPTWLATAPNRAILAIGLVYAALAAAVLIIES